MGIAGRRAFRDRCRVCGRTHNSRQHFTTPAFRITAAPDSMKRCAGIMSPSGVSPRSSFPEGSSSVGSGAPGRVLAHGHELVAVDGDEHDRVRVLHERNPHAQGSIGSPGAARRDPRARLAWPRGQGGTSRRRDHESQLQGRGGRRDRRPADRGQSTPNCSGSTARLSTRPRSPLRRPVSDPKCSAFVWPEG